jgi:hypothetical protein
MGDINTFSLLFPWARHGKKACMVAYRLRTLGILFLFGEKRKRK